MEKFNRLVLTFWILFSINIIVWGVVFVLKILEA